MHYSVRCTQLDRDFLNRGLDPGGFWLTPPVGLLTSYGSLMGAVLMNADDAHALAAFAAGEHPQATFEVVSLEVTVVDRYLSRDPEER